MSSDKLSGFWYAKHIKTLPAEVTTAEGWVEKWSRLWLWMSGFNSNSHTDNLNIEDKQVLAEIIS